MKFVLGDEIGFVQLVQSCGDDLSVVNAARVSFGRESSEFTDRDRKLITFLLEHEHGTPLEHNSLTFLVKCPLFVARQWHRHRIGISINEISARYVTVTEEFYVPQAFRQQSQSNRQASVAGQFTPEQADQSLRIYQHAIDQSLTAYRQLLQAGVAREQARAVLPTAMYTQFFWTCNLRSLLHFVRLRSHADAQWEIQQYADAMLAFAREIFPETISCWSDLP